MGSSRRSSTSRSATVRHWCSSWRRAPRGGRSRRHHGCGRTPQRRAARPAEVDVEPGLTLRADPDRLGQALRALIDNAVKFSDGRGTVLVRGSAADAGDRAHRGRRPGHRHPRRGRAADLRALLPGGQHGDAAFRRHRHGAGPRQASRGGTWRGGRRRDAPRVRDADGAALAGAHPRRRTMCPTTTPWRPRCRYNEGGRARRGVSGALYPQSAIAGLNSPPRGRVIGSAPDAPALTTGSRAARAREPRQVRKEAAVSGLPGVPWGHLV